MLKLLLKANKDLDLEIKDKSDCTALSAAFWENRANHFQPLLEAGAVVPDDVKLADMVKFIGEGKQAQAKLLLSVTEDGGKERDDRSGR